MKVVFIAGPFRASTPWKIEQNIRKAETLSLEVAYAGFMPLCPHTNTRFFDGECSDQFWLEGTSELLRRCDALLTVKGWEDSIGARAEVTLAKGEKIPIFHSLEDLVLERWIK
jgi:hypothetical protein